MRINYIKCGDCLELMSSLSVNCIDLTITSPPYDNLRDYKKYDFNFEKIAIELFRLTKPGGVLVWVVGDSVVNGSETGTSFCQALFFKEIGFNLHDTMIYQKGSCAYPETVRYYQDFEYMFVLSKGKPKTINLIADKKNKYYGDKITATDRQTDGTIKPCTAIRNNTGRRTKEYGVRTNIWYIPAGKNKTTTDNFAYEHPAMFPEALANDHILTWSNEGDLVFDPFLGSGTTAKMAALNNRNFIGFEIAKEYFEIAKKRILTVTYVEGVK